MGNRAGKGSVWERDVSRKLSLWVSGEGKRDDIFWRTRGSGAFHTTRFQKHKVNMQYQAGDIGLNDASSAIGKVFLDNLFIECKHLKRVEVWPGTGGWNVFWKIWEKALQESHSAGGRFPLVIIKTDRKPPVVFMSPALAKTVKIKRGSITLAHADLLRVQGVFLEDLLAYHYPYFIQLAIDLRGA